MKRDLKYIIKRIIIGTGIALAVMFIKDEVLAATTIQTYQYRTTYDNAHCSTVSATNTTICVNTGGNITSSLTPFGTATAGPKYIKSNTINFVTPNDNSKMFIQGQQCQIKFTVNWNPRDSQAKSAALEGVPVFQYYNGSQYVNFTDATLNRSLSNDNYGIDYYYNFTVPQTTRYMQVVLDYPTSGNSGVLRNSSSEGLNVVKGSVNCATNSTDIAIQDAGNQITGAINSALDILSNALAIQTSTISQSVTGLGIISNDIKNALIEFKNSFNNFSGKALSSDTTGIDTSGLSSNNNDLGTGISGLVLMPGNLLSQVINSSDTCDTYNLGQLYGTNLNFPCIDPEDTFGSALWSIFDILIAGTIIYNIAKRFIKIFHDFTNLKDQGADDLYGGGL